MNFNANPQLCSMQISWLIFRTVVVVHSKKMFACDKVMNKFAHWQNNNKGIRQRKLIKSYPNFITLKNTGKETVHDTLTSGPISTWEIGDTLPQNICIISQHLYSKENYIGPVVSKILRYTHRHIDLFYIRILYMYLSITHPSIWLQSI